MTYYKSFPEIAHTTKTNQQTNKKCICKREGCEREGERERERETETERDRELRVSLTARGGTCFLPRTRNKVPVQDGQYAFHSPTSRQGIQWRDSISASCKRQLSAAFTDCKRILHLSLLRLSSFSIVSCPFFLSSCSFFPLLLHTSCFSIFHR